MALPIHPNQGRETNAAPFSERNTPFDAIGGAARVQDLVDRFYAHMEGDPVFASTRALYPRDDLRDSRQKLFQFLVGWLGGPQLYTENRGHPRLRMRHAPFRIDDVARNHWIACMTRALDELGIEGDLRAFLDARFAHVADFLRNV